MSAMRSSLESAVPILSQEHPHNRASTRFSAYSMAPSSVQGEQSSAPSGSDPRLSEMNNYTTSLDRMESRRLQEQRYTISPQKEDDMKKLALAGKVQRALDRRFTSQDASFTPQKSLSEKTLTNS